MKNKIPFSVVVLSMLFVSGCSLLGGATGTSVAKKLNPGMTKEKVLVALAHGATGLNERINHTVGTDGWNELLELKPVAQSMKTSEDKTGKKIHTCSEISRSWGFMGYDIFYLYLSEKDILIGFTQQHIN